MKIQTNALLAAAAMTLFGTAPAFADEAAPNNTLRVGFEDVFYHTSADNLAGPFVPAGVNFKAKDLQTLYIGYVRNLSTHFLVELALGYPPLSKVEGRGPATVGSVPYNGQTVSSARWLSPTVFLEYEFFDRDAKLRPFIGAGMNYTAFYDREFTAQGNAASGGPTKLSLNSSVGPAGTMGLDYHISGNWHAYASYSISQVKTRIFADTDGVIRTSHIKFGPQVLVIAAGYSF